LPYRGEYTTRQWLGQIAILSHGVHRSTAALLCPPGYKMWPSRRRALSSIVVSLVQIFSARATLGYDSCNETISMHLFGF